MHIFSRRSRPHTPGVVRVLDFSPGRFAALLRSLLKSSSEDMLNPARATTKDDQGLHEKIPVSVKSLTA